jgi:paraquat-inducible protein B
MNPDQRLWVRVGAMVLGGIATIAGLTVWIGADVFRQRGQVFETYFSESVQGLDPGAAVRFRGVQLGRVTEVQLAFVDYRDALRAMPMEDARARLVVVRFDVAPGRLDAERQGRVQDAVGSGLRVRMASQGVTGVSYLELDFVDPRRYPVPSLPWTPRSPFVPSVPSTLTQFQSGAEALLAQLRDADLPGLLREATAALSAIREQLTAGEGYAALVAASDAMRSLDATLRAVSPAATGALAEAQAAAAAVRGLAQGPVVAEAQAAATSLRAGLARLPATLGAAEAAARRLDALGADATRDLPPLLRDLRIAADNLRAVTEQLRQYPSQLLLGAPPPRESGR